MSQADVENVHFVIGLLTMLGFLSSSRLRVLRSGSELQ